MISKKIYFTAWAAWLQIRKVLAPPSAKNWHARLEDEQAAMYEAYESWHNKKHK